jgi:hypothetical protein
MCVALLFGVVTVTSVIVCLRATCALIDALAKYFEQVQNRRDTRPRGPPQTTTMPPLAQTAAGTFDLLTGAVTPEVERLLHS